MTQITIKDAKKQIRARIDPYHQTAAYEVLERIKQGGPQSFRSARHAIAANAMADAGILYLEFGPFNIYGIADDQSDPVTVTA